MNLFKTKFGIPATFGNTNDKQINIFKYWYILWFDGLNIRHDEGNQHGEWKTLQDPYINWWKQRLTNLIDNILNIIGSGFVTYILLKFFDITIK